MALKKQIPYNDNNRAVAYYRYSSSGQDTSIEQQQEAAHTYAKLHGLTITHEYADPAISGTSADRPKFQLMLAEIGKLKPAALILWKTDRLSRDNYDVAFAKKKIRDAGVKIHYVAEKTPDDDCPEDELMEGFLEKMATYYSKQLSVNVKRGQKFNSERCLYLGVKTLGYTYEGEGRHNKRIVIDESTAPLVRRIFNDYADGLTMAQICDKLKAEGRKTSRGNDYTINGIRRILKNDAYIGVYRYGDIVVEDGMPAIISKELFNVVQAMLVKNKKFGAQNARGLDEDDNPRFWLTGKLFCGECSTSEHDEPMQGTSGRSKTGAKYYYYSCNDQHKGKKGKGCKKKPVRKEIIEDLVINHLTKYLQDSENLMSLAVDISVYYKNLYGNNEYLDSLKAEYKETEKSLNNVIKAVMAGASGETINNQLNALEEAKKSLKDAIELEEIKSNVVKDEISVKNFFEQFKNADLNDIENRDLVLNYFVDKIYLYDDRMIITGKWDSDYEGTGYLFVEEVKKRSGKKSSTASCCGAR